MKDLLKDYGTAILDTRDFFNQNFVENYKKTVIETRKEFKSKLDVCTAKLPYTDGCPAWTSDFMDYMIKRLDKDYSYLYDGTYFHKTTDKWWPQIDHNFTMDCFEYFDKNNIDVNSLSNDDIPALSMISQGFYHQCALDFAYPKGAVLDYLLMNDEINIKITDKFSDFRKDRIKLLGENHAKEIEKRIFLQSIDLNWKTHIQYLEHLRQVVGLRSYGQRDPLIEYKKEAFDLFSNLLEKLKLDFITILINLKIVKEQEEERQTKQSIVEQIKSGQKIGRNEKCSCGSGKKYKHCCGAL